MTLRFRVAAILCSLIAACATTPHTAEPETKDTAWLAASVDAPSGEAGRECVDSALRTSFALVALRSGASEDHVIKDALLSGVEEPTLREQRVREYALWEQSHDVSVVAADHLTWCLAGYGILVKEPQILPRCLHATEPVAMLSLARHGGDNRVLALERTTASYKDVLPAAELTRYSVLVYAAANEAEELVLRANSFRNCLMRVH